MTLPGAQNKSISYEIRIAGHLNDRWKYWFEGMQILCLSSGDTVITSRVIDQAALHGLLNRISDLGLTLISVNKVDYDRADGGI